MGYGEWDDGGQPPSRPPYSGSSSEYPVHPGSAHDEPPATAGRARHAHPSTRFDDLDDLVDPITLQRGDTRHDGADGSGRPPDPPPKPVWTPRTRQQRARETSWSDTSASGIPRVDPSPPGGYAPSTPGGYDSAAPGGYGPSTPDGYPAPPEPQRDSRRQAPPPYADLYSNQPQPHPELSLPYLREPTSSYAAPARTDPDLVPPATARPAPPATARPTPATARPVPPATVRPTPPPERISPEPPRPEPDPHWPYPEPYLAPTPPSSEPHESYQSREPYDPYDPYDSYGGPVPSSTDTRPPDPVPATPIPPPPIAPASGPPRGGPPRSGPPRGGPPGPGPRAGGPESKRSPEPEAEADAEPDSDGTYRGAAIAALIWCAVPVVFYVAWALVLAGRAEAGCVDDNGQPCASPQVVAWQDLLVAAPMLGAAAGLSVLIALMLRWLTTGWRSTTVGFASAVVASGVVTVVWSALSQA